MKVSIPSIALFTKASISSFLSAIIMSLTLGLVFGCFGTNIVQQSSYGSIDVS